MEGPKKESLVRHFSHEHPLEPVALATANALCSGCKLRILSGTDCYCCRTCQIFLHQLCLNMPHPDDNVDGWLEISKSPGGNFKKGVSIVSPSTDQLLQQEDKSFLHSEISTTPSFQFSDAYFSIDLAKSYSTDPELKKEKINSITTLPTIQGFRASKHEKNKEIRTKGRALGSQNKAMTRSLSPIDISANDNGFMGRGDYSNESENGKSSRWRKLFFCC